MFDYVVIAFVAIVAVGLVELVKNFLPESTNSKVLTLISLVISAALPIVYGIAMKQGVLKPVVSTLGVVGLTQTSYDFVFKLLKSAIEKLKTKVTEALNKDSESSAE